MFGRDRVQNSLAGGVRRLGHGPNLGAVAQGRDNNFNLMRMMAAVAVLVSHAWPLTLGKGAAEPLQGVTGQSLGHLAVLLFFAISGFLIADSFERDGDWRRFLRARALRLLPGLGLSLLLVAFLLGPLVTALATPDYLTDSRTWAFLWRNLTLVWPQFDLPGVFATNPYVTVEGSIWTLGHEVGCYLGLLLVGLTGILRRPGLLVIVAGAHAGLWLAVASGAVEPHPRIAAFLDLSLPFGLGVLAHRFRYRIDLCLTWVGLAVAVAALTRGTVLEAAGIALAVTALALWGAYVPGGWARRYNRLGDYSYGLYLYAFPLQGLVVWLWGPMTPIANIALSLPPTLALAVLSWHLVERPALSLARGQGGGRGLAWPARRHGAAIGPRVQNADALV